jgi:alkanesulfonate monooxygenase SsuD/methylene tetrahydromethanopterin reductase-like flavin-dependent oxidoreductase (luciferase family)
MSESALPNPRFGLIFDFSAPPEWVASSSRYWSDLMAMATLAEGLGFDVIWISEHHFTGFDRSTSPVLMAASLAGVTKRIRLGTYIAILPFYHPLRLAEDVAAVDVLSDGRFELGLGLGYRTTELEAFGIAREERGRRLPEQLAILRRAWSDQGVSASGPTYAFPEVDVRPKPIQKPHPPLWLSGRSVFAARRAARLGTHLHLLGGQTIRGAYLEELTKLGQDPDAFRVSVFRPFFVTEDPEATLAEFAPQFDYFGRRQGTWVGGDRDVAFDAELGARWRASALEGMNYLFGTPESCLIELQRYHERKPFTDYIAPLLPPYDLDAVSRSLELFASRVMKPFRHALQEMPAAVRDPA